VASDSATFENNCVKTNKDKPTLSAAKMFSIYSSFWRYNVYADIRGVFKFLDPEDGSQNATLVVVLVVGINALKIPKALLLCDTAQ